MDWQQFMASEGVNNWNVRWDLLEKVKLAFDENGISIPFPQRDVHLYPYAAPATD